MGKKTAEKKETFQWTNILDMFSKMPLEGAAALGAFGSSSSIIPSAAAKPQEGAIGSFSHHRV